MVKRKAASGAWRWAHVAIAENAESRVAELRVQEPGVSSGAVVARRRSLPCAFAQASVHRGQPHCPLQHRRKHILCNRCAGLVAVAYSQTRWDEAEFRLDACERELIKHAIRSMCEKFGVGLDECRGHADIGRASVSLIHKTPRSLDLFPESIDESRLIYEIFSDDCNVARRGDVAREDKNCEEHVSCRCARPLRLSFFFNPL